MRKANARLNVTLDPEVLEVLNAECQKLGISRSAYISMACLQKMQSDKAIGMLPALLKPMAQLLENLTSDESLTALKSAELKELVDTISSSSDISSDAVG